MSDQLFGVQKVQRLLSKGFLLLSLLGGAIVPLGVAAAPAPASPATESLDAETPIIYDTTTLRFFNHDILTMRATVYGYPPDERARAALERIQLALDAPGIPTVTTKPMEKLFAIELNGRMVFFVAPKM